jgi:hypothetical protein
MPKSTGARAPAPVADARIGVWTPLTARPDGRTTEEGIDATIGGTMALSATQMRHLLHQVAEDDRRIPDSWGGATKQRRTWVWGANHESSFDPRASNGSFHGLYQMSQTTLRDWVNRRFGGRDISWQQYQHGDRQHSAAYYQTKAGLLYGKERYGSAAAAKAHWDRYGWW